MSFAQRLGFLALAATVGVVLIVLRLYDLQISDRAHWEANLRDRSHLSRSVFGPRGRILDAAGTVLAADGPGFDLMVQTAAWTGTLHRCDVCSYDLYLLPGQRRNYRRCPRCKSDTAEHLFPLGDRCDLRPLARLLKMTEREVRERLDKLVDRHKQRVADVLEKQTRLSERRLAKMAIQLRREYGWRPIVFKRDVSYEVVREVTLHRDRNPPFRIRESRSRRNYGGPAFAHLIGIEPDAVVRARNLARDESSGTGTGLERTFDSELRGESGSVSKGPDRDRPGYFKVLHSSRPIPGLNLRLTLRRRDQVAALKAMGRRVGAFVVVNAETGAVLAMVSTPTYDPDRYGEVAARMIKLRDRARAQKRRLRIATPLFARAVRGVYPPGSIFKPFTAFAGLRAGVIDADDTIVCNKLFVLDGRTMTNSMKCMAAHGPVELRRALVQSCNIYFQTVVDRLILAGREEEFRETARLFGFGQPTGFELESTATIRKHTFQLRPRGRTPPKGARLQAGIGQGLVTVTPAQMARAYAAIATGSLPDLHVVASIGDRRESTRRTRLPLPAAEFEAVRRSLRAKTAADPNLQDPAFARYRVGTKTGTAQKQSVSTYTAWLAGFAPAQSNRPPIAFAMVVENADDYGGATCGPLVARFLAEFYGADSETGMGG